MIAVLKPKDTPENWTKLNPIKENDEALLVGERLTDSRTAIDQVGSLWRSTGRRIRRRPAFPGSAVLRSLMALPSKSPLRYKTIVCKVKWLCESVSKLKSNWRSKSNGRSSRNNFRNLRGWELAARWKTARQVGGDFYDVIELPNRKLGIIIADVADKGVPAALFMALTRTLVRAAAIEASSPAEALQRVNDLLMPDTRQGMFVTGVYAVLDQETGEFTYANAGHNPPFWIRNDGQIEKLTRTGIALGVTEANLMTQRTVRIASGESVLLYTDGVTEAFSPGWKAVWRISIDGGHSIKYRTCSGSIIRQGGLLPG